MTSGCEARFSLNFHNKHKLVYNETGTQCCAPVFIYHKV